MDINQILAALGNGGGGGINVPRPMAMNPQGAMPQLPRYAPAQAAPTSSAQMAATQALNQPPPPQQNPMAGMGNIMQMAQMGKPAEGNDISGLFGLNQPKPVNLPFQMAGGGTGSTPLNVALPDLGGQSAGLHGLFHRLSGMFGG